MSRHQFPLDFSLWSELTDGRFDKNIQTWYISMIYDIYITVCRFREKLPAKQLRCVSKWNWFHNKWITLKSVIYQNQLGVFVELGFLMVLYFWPAGELRCRIALITSPAFAWEMSKKKKKKRLLIDAEEIRMHKDLALVLLSVCLPLNIPFLFILPVLASFHTHSFLCSEPELDNPEARVQEIHSIVHRLPEKNHQMLELLTKHLAK